MDNKELAHTQEEIRQTLRILINIVWKLGVYLYNHFDDPNIKEHLRDLGKELKQIKEPRKR